MHVADTLGEDAESVCAHLVHNGRLTFRQLVHLMAAHLRDEVPSAVEGRCADTISQLFLGRLVEQVSIPPQRPQLRVGTGPILLCYLVTCISPNCGWKSLGWDVN
jgi:hypothetical protein